ncbi:MAG: hypothetical protein NPMRTH5_1510001 [Nitrosopumilales archaeon]|nr:MAG: hypothetical protein NPMRTH5_1510001 [Nitrosopumilales archaeon]
MAKWADYLISEVKYGKNHLIEEVKFHTDVDGVISEPKMVDRSQIAHNVKNGKTYRIIFHSLKGWKLGNLINVLRVSGDYFIRIDKNKVDRDFLGQIPEF